MTDTPAYQMLDSSHPAVQAVIKGKSQQVTGTQDNPNFVELRTAPASVPPQELEKQEDKTAELNLKLAFTPSQYAVLTRKAIQMNLDVKDICQLLMDSALEKQIGKAHIDSPGGNRKKITGPSNYTRSDR